MAATKVILDAWKPRLAIVTTVEAEERLTVDLLAASWLRVVYVDPDDEEEDDEDHHQREPDHINLPPCSFEVVQRE